MRNKVLHYFQDPDGLVALHKWATIFWFLAAFPICILLAESIPFIVFISVYAVVTGHWASWQAGRTEVEQKKMEKKQMEMEEKQLNAVCRHCGKT